MIESRTRSCSSRAFCGNPFTMLLKRLNRARELVKMIGDRVNTGGRVAPRRSRAAREKTRDKCELLQPLNILRSEFPGRCSVTDVGPRLQWRVSDARIALAMRYRNALEFHA